MSLYNGLKLKKKWKMLSNRMELILIANTTSHVQICWLEIKQKAQFTEELTWRLMITKYDSATLWALVCHPQFPRRSITTGTNSQARSKTGRYLLLKLIMYVISIEFNSWFHKFLHVEAILNDICDGHVRQKMWTKRRQTCLTKSFWITHPARAAKCSSLLSDLNQSAATNCITGVPAFTWKSSPYLDNPKF